MPVINWDRTATQDEKCLIIAEIGINHNGDLELAKKMIDIAEDIGVDGVKFQRFKAEDFISDKSLNFEYQSQGKVVKESMYEMFKRFEFSDEEWRVIAQYCGDKGILFFVTPQNMDDLESMERIMTLPIIKVGSDDLTNTRLLSEYAKRKKPMIISAGMAYLSEVEGAIATIRKEGCNQLLVLHCVSSYPAENAEVNMRKMNTIRDAFDVEVGFSDHTIGSRAAIVAVALGAKMIEKHFTLDKNLPGPDHWFSCDPEELEELVTAVRETELILGSKVVSPTEREMEMRKIARRSIVAQSTIQKGQCIQPEDVNYKRPGDGLAPNMVSHIVGKIAKRCIEENEQIHLKDVE